MPLPGLLCSPVTRFQVCWVTTATERKLAAVSRWHKQLTATYIPLTSPFILTSCFQQGLRLGTAQGLP